MIKTAVISGLTSSFNIEHDGGEYLDQLSQEGSGGFLISAHLGNWEVAGHLMKRLNKPVNIILLDGEDEQIKKVMNETIGERYFKIIAMKSDMSHIFKIHEAAKNKELICIHGDRFLPGSKTIKSSFLGSQADFPLGPFAMASKLKLPVAFVYGVKEGKSKYRFICTKPTVKVQDKSAIFSDYIKLLEKMVQEYPNQWFNYFSFWTNNTHSTN